MKHELEDIEQLLRDRLQEVPTPEVDQAALWNAVEAKIGVQKKKRFFGMWIFGAILLVGLGTWAYITGFEKKSEDRQTMTTPQRTEEGGASNSEQNATKSEPMEEKSEVESNSTIVEESNATALASNEKANVSSSSDSKLGSDKNGQRPSSKPKSNTDLSATQGKKLLPVIVSNNAAQGEQQPLREPQNAKEGVTLNTSEHKESDQLQAENAKDDQAMDATQKMAAEDGYTASAEGTIEPDLSISGLQDVTQIDQDTTVLASTDSIIEPLSPERWLVGAKGGINWLRLPNDPLLDHYAIAGPMAGFEWSYVNDRKINMLNLSLFGGATKYGVRYSETGSTQHTLEDTLLTIVIDQNSLVAQEVIGDTTVNATYQRNVQYNNRYATVGLQAVYGVKRPFVPSSAWHYSFGIGAQVQWIYTQDGRYRGQDGTLTDPLITKNSGVHQFILQPMVQLGIDRRIGQKWWIGAQFNTSYLSKNAWVVPLSKGAMQYQLGIVLKR